MSEHIDRIRAFAHWIAQGKGHATQEAVDAMALLADYDALAARLAEAEAALRMIATYREDDGQCDNGYSPGHIARTYFAPDSAPAVECKWTQDLDGNWATGCGQMWCLIDGTPADNDMTYCHHCGKRIKESLYLDPDDDGIEADQPDGAA